MDEPVMQVRETMKRLAKASRTFVCHFEMSNANCPYAV